MWTGAEGSHHLTGIRLLKTAINFWKLQLLIKFPKHKQQYSAGINQGSSTRFSKASLHHWKVSSFFQMLLRKQQKLSCVCFWAFWITSKTGQPWRKMQSYPESLSNSFWWKLAFVNIVIRRICKLPSNLNRLHFLQFRGACEDFSCQLFFFKKKKQITAWLYFKV